MAGFNIRKHLKAYVKYNLHNGQKIVPGSLIFREQPPKDPGIWKEVDTVKCCPGDISCAGGGFWINEIEMFSLTYPTAAVVGNDCNIYNFLGDNGFYQFLKFNKSGDLVWNVSYDISELYMTTSTMKISPDGDLYSMGEYGLAKLKSKDGSVVWSKGWGFVDSITILGIAFDKTGNIIMFAIDYDLLFFIVKINPNTGAVITQKQIDFSGISDNGYTESYSIPFIDDSGNIYICGTYYYSYPDYYSGGVFIKLDSNFNIITSVYLNSLNNSYEYQSSLAIDALGNSYMVIDDGLSVVKLDADSQVVWAKGGISPVTTYEIELYSCVVSPVGDVFWIYNFDDGYWNNVDPDYNSRMIVVKFNSLGERQWITAVTYAPGGTPTNLYMGGWNIANDPVEYKNGVIVIAAWSPSYGPTPADLLIKLSPNEQTLGTFGDFTFADITDKFDITDSPVTPVNISLTISDSNYFDEYNETEITYTASTNDITVTKTPLS